MEILKHHNHGHNETNYWASWCSPVGLGIFFATTAIAAYVLLSIIGGLVSLMRPTPSYSYPAAYPSEAGSAMGATGSGQ